MTALLHEWVYMTLAFYFIASILYFAGSKKPNYLRFGLTFALAGLITNSLALIARGMLVDRLPLANGAEFMLWFGLFTVLPYLLYEKGSGNRGAGGVVMSIAALLILTIPILMPNQLASTSALMPALKSPWLTSHVLTAVFAYGGFAVAAGIAAVQLRKPSPKGDGWINRIVAISFAMLTLTIVLGAIWAEQAWGKYWSWDPKETWALITWIIYAIYFHLYRQKEWKGRRSNILVISGFILVLATFFGVNFLLPGQHSYA